MSVDLPDSLDAWRAVVARRTFEGRIDLSQLPRLVESLAEATGDCRFRLQFDRDPFGWSMVEVDVDTTLSLTCQRSLQPFRLPVSIRQRLGLVRNEAEEAALPPEVEPVLVGADGLLTPRDLIEDELILALPVVPLGPLCGAEPEPEAPDEEQTRVNPFAALAALKKQPS